MPNKNLLKAILFCIVSCFVLSLAVNAMAITAKWDASEGWNDQTKVVLIITKPDGKEYRLPPVSAKGCAQKIEDNYFDYSQTYQIQAVAFDDRGESQKSNAVAYTHRDGPRVLELPVMVPEDRPDTLILTINF